MQAGLGAARGNLTSGVNMHANEVEPGYHDKRLTSEARPRVYKMYINFIIN